MENEIDDVMGQVMTDLGTADKIVIDARFNQGGRDTMGYAIVGWFTDTDVLVARKRAVAPGGWTEEQEIFVTPRGDAPYLGPVALLTSGNTISAAETFAQAMRELPNVTTVGARTYGIFSDVLMRQLPNGWFVAPSNEVYASPDGRVFEVAGLPPDVVVNSDAEVTFSDNLMATVNAAVDAI